MRRDGRPLQANLVSYLLCVIMQVPELEVLEMVEKMGNPSKDEGEWIARIDLVESGKALKLEEQEELGKCDSECKTVQKAVEDILGEHDTDMAEKLWLVRASLPHVRYGEDHSRLERHIFQVPQLPYSDISVIPIQLDALYAC